MIEQYHLFLLGTNGGDLRLFAAKGGGLARCDMGWA